MTKVLFRFFCLLFFSFSISGCVKEDRDPCLQPKTAVLVAGASRHANGTNNLIDTALPNPLLIPLSNGIQQYAFGGIKRVKRLTFSLSNLADSSRWILRPDSAFANQDTLTFYYQRQLYFLSNACGYTYYYFIDSVRTTRNAIDSVRLNRSDITNDANVENLKIIFR